ncbi:SoxR reducing system RseC family protein [Spirochaetota bacterium]
MKSTTQAHLCSGTVDTIKDNRTVEVILADEKECKTCGVCFSFGGKRRITVRTAITCSQGDQVQVKIAPARNTVRNSFLVFGIPLILFAGVYSVYFFLSEVPNEILGFFISLTFVFAWYFILRIFNKWITRKEGVRAEVIEKNS